MIKQLLSATALTLGLVAPAHAQDVNADAIYETVTLSGGFTPDPYTINLSSGGTNDAAKVSPECAGFIATSPDVRLNFQAGSLPLYISAAAQSDTTLVVNAPDGNWYCDDDSGGGFDPLLSFNRPLSGRYEIWVGTYGESNTYPATLSISEIGNSATPQANQSATGPDTNADPIYETVSLSSGFTPDPYVVRMSSGGPNDAAYTASGCVGFIANSPDVRLNFNAGSLPLIISAASMADTTLVINAPDGKWYCNDDDGQDSNPMVRFQTPLSGRYEIWVGTFGDNNSHQTELNISELYSQ